VSATPVVPVRDNSAAAAPVIEVQDLHVRLTGREVDVVRGVSFALAPGEVLGLVGESGSGKTTVALALLGYARPGTTIVGGAVIVDGVDVLTRQSSDLRRLRGRLVSYVPQDPSSSLNPAIRIGTQLMEVLDEHEFGADRNARRARLAEMLAEVDLASDAGFLSRYPHQLSGGQQQRVAIAMAFACRPPVVVLDEPTTGLDVTTQAHVLKTVRELAHVHRTAAVYVTHDLAVVAGLSNRIAVMYAGGLIEVGPADEVVRDAAHPYTRRLIAAVPDPKERRPLVGIPGRVAPLGPRKPGCVFADRCEFVEEACRVSDIALERVTAAHVARCRRLAIVRRASRPGAGDQRIHGRDAAATPPLIEVDNLVASYGQNTVLHGTSLAIPEGRCVALVGESGSGKTTLARCISGMHAEAQGSIRLGGDVLPLTSRKRPAELRRTIQYVFQNPYSSLNPRMSVGELLEQPLRQFGLPRKDDVVPELLEQVSLSSRYAQRYPSQLSGGERQRVAIARALAVSPKVLICDEITSALDVSVQASILALLARLHAEASLSVLFVTHNLAVVRAIADSVVVLDRGRIVEEGSVDQVLDEPRDDYTKQLLKDTPAFA
jgi:peptide/nickel transport system ATP-binding protein